MVVSSTRTCPAGLVDIATMNGEVSDTAPASMSLRRLLVKLLEELALETGTTQYEFSSEGSGAAASLAMRMVALLPRRVDSCNMTFLHQRGTDLPCQAGQPSFSAVMSQLLCSSPRLGVSSDDFFQPISEWSRSWGLTEASDDDDSDDGTPYCFGITQPMAEPVMLSYHPRLHNPHRCNRV